MNETQTGRLILLTPACDKGGAAASGAETPVTAVFTQAERAFLPGFATGKAEQGAVPQSKINLELRKLGLFAEVAAHGLLSDVFVCAECSSTFDVAWLLNNAGLLPEWGAVIALRQSAGRGQMRRAWQSPEGNLHVSFRLPQRFVQEEAASVLTGLLFAEAFARLDLELLFKWPNDLVLPLEASGAGGWGKLGGLLLEERAGVLLAGLGLNIAALPEAAELRREAALPAARLPENFLPRRPVQLWLDLVQKVLLVYKNLFTASSTKDLLCKAEKYLLWKGSEVQVLNAYESGSISRGLLCGLTELGGLRLLVPSLPSTAEADPFKRAGPAADWAFSGLPREIALYSGSLKGPNDA